MAELWPRMSVRASFETTPPNAEVLARPYAADNREWTRFGRAPLNRVRLPWGPSRIQVRAEGYETFETLELFSGQSGDDAVHAPRSPGLFQRAWYGSPGAPRWVPRSSGSRFSGPVSSPGYSIDRTEVSNEAFKAFVDGGGSGRGGPGSSHSRELAVC